MWFVDVFPFPFGASSGSMLILLGLINADALPSLAGKDDVGILELQLFFVFFSMVKN